MLPQYHWTQLALPPRHFNWRIRGNSLQWALTERATLTKTFDLLIATSMVDLASLRGFIPALAGIPSVLYFHENQFDYPPGRQQESNVEPQLVPIYSAICADRIVFNSTFNRRSFLEGARSLFQRLPDIDADSVLGRLKQSTVIPVPLVDSSRHSKPALPGPLQVIWNHRWEYDKGPELLLQLAHLICQNQLPLRLHIVGEQFRQRPGQFDEIDRLLSAHARANGWEAGSFGFIEQSEDYQALLRSGDVVLSTALHDFQGLAVQEACQAGCTPLAPDDLVYPEYLGAEFLYQRGADDLATAAEICRRLQQWHALKLAARALPKPDLQRYQMTAVASQYNDLFRELLQPSGSS
jgi:glycosyltransferase involved in cell wall biosynthesis